MEASFKVCIQSISASEEFHQMDAVVNHSVIKNEAKRHSSRKAVVWELENVPHHDGGTVCQTGKPTGLETRWSVLVPPALARAV